MQTSTLAEVTYSIAERRVIDALSRAVVVTDTDGRALLWNAAAEYLFERPEPEALGRAFVDLVTPAEDADAHRQALAGAAGGSQSSFEWDLRRSDGSIVHLSTIGRPIAGDGGEVVALVVVTEDVTDRRDTEQRSRDLSEHFAAALQAGGLGTWRWDMATGVTVWDERMEALFGLEPGEFDGSYDTYVSLLHPDDRDEVMKIVEAAVATRTPYRVEHRVVWPDGSTHWIFGAGAVTVDDHGVVTGTVGCSTDITERIVQAQELHRLAALALEAAENERLQRERLEFVGSINDALQRSFSVQDVMANVTAQAVPGLGDLCSIHVVPASGGVPDVEVAHADPAMVAQLRELARRIGREPEAPLGAARVIRTGEAEFHPELGDDVLSSMQLSDELCELLAQLSPRSWICVPLTKRGRVLGALQFVMSSSSRRYTPDDLALARTVANRIASSIENLRLHEQQRMIASTLQRSLLPAALPDVPGIEIAARYWAAGAGVDVGGDFYDVFQLREPDHWALVIGDVCGTGPEAAALTGLARHSIRGSAWHGDSPVEVLASLNHAVLAAGTGRFLTAAYATLRFDERRPVLTVACGGHPMPLHAGRDGVHTIGVPGTLLGMFEDAAWSARTAELDAGDVLVFYTDGATDVAPPHALDPGELAAIVERATATATSAEQVADHVHDALEEVLGFAERNDDIALLIVRIKGGTDRAGR